jgi:flagellar motor switch/type III secretory pathway protein FliN
MAETLFSSTKPPDSLLFTPALRHALLTQHLEEQNLMLLDRKFTFAQLSLVEKKENLPVTKACESWFYHVPSSLGGVVLGVHNTSEGFNITKSVRAWKGILPDWSLPVWYRVGWSPLPFSLLNTLVKGDLVLVTQRQQTLMLAGQCIGHWNFNEQGVVMESMSKNVEGIPEHPSYTPATQGQDVSSLQDVDLVVEIVLGDAQLPLVQAVALDAGDFVPLTRGGVKAAQLRLGNQTIARGELVEVEGQLGVILDHVYFQSDGQR